MLLHQRLHYGKFKIQHISPEASLVVTSLNEPLRHSHLNIFLHKGILAMLQALRAEMQQIWHG